VRKAQTGKNIDPAKKNASANLHRLCFVRIVAPSSLQKRVMLRGGYKNRVQEIAINMTQSTNSIRNTPSGDIGSSSLLSSSISPRGMSDGMLKLVLRLELPLPERPGLLPVENEGRRGEGGSTGDGEAGGGEGADDLPSSKAGISVSGLSETIFGLGDPRTTLNFVQFSIVAYIWRLWLRYLHLTVLL